MAMARTNRVYSLAYHEQGEGLPLVLLHAFPTDRRIFADQVAALSAKYRVITPDLKGFGQSKNPEPFTMESAADDAHSLLSELDALPCVLGGISMGGYISLAYAKKYPSTLKGLILIDTRAQADSPEGRNNRTAMIDLARTQGSTAVAGQMLPKMVCQATQKNNPNVVSRLKQIMEQCPAQTIEYASAAMRDRPDQTELLPSITGPTLIIVGKEDSLTPPAMSEMMHQSIRGSVLSMVEDAGHMTVMEQPDAVNRAIDGFLGNR